MVKRWVEERAEGVWGGVVEDREARRAGANMAVPYLLDRWFE